METQLPRRAAIRKLAEVRLASLEPGARSDRLSSMVGEDWDFDFFSSDAPMKDLLDQFSEAAASDAIFDAPLLERLAFDYQYATNAYLQSELKRLAKMDVRVEGVFDPGIACPCCGLETLDEVGGYDICPVCWWEDDGADTRTYTDPPPAMEIDDLFSGEPASERMQESLHALGMGPNRVDLLTARINYIEKGISEPARTDLREFQEPPEKYAQGRKFEWDRKTWTLSEPAVGWSGRVKTPPR